MKDLFKGWEYINALLQTIKMYNDSHSDIIAPRYIFRGITQRHFTSSKCISDNLTNNAQLLEDAWCELCKNKPEYISKEKSPIPEVQEICYSNYVKALQTEYYHKLCLENPCEYLKCIIKTTDYYFTKPEYIRSGAAVRMNGIERRTQTDYIYYLKDMISEMKRRYPDYRNKNDLDILAEIQHKGGASCLVDFSTNFLISLWFATQDYSRKEMGYLFCYDTNTDLFINNNITIINSAEDEPIDVLLYQTQKSIKYNGRDDYKFLIWKPSNINNRITRQDSIFVFGLEQFEVREHPIITLPIPYEWKEAIQRTLKHLFGISSETIYADASGYASSNTKLDSCKITTSYFNTEVFPISFDLMDSFQRAMSCIVKREYDLALQYIYKFECGNVDRLQKLSENIDNSYNTLFYIEFIYSKALSCHRTEKYSEAIFNYKMAFERCLEFLHFSKYKTLKPLDDFQELEKEDKKALHATNKLYKIIDNYIDALFFLKRYDEAYDAIIEIYELEGPDEDVKILLKTAINEIRLLKFLSEGEKLTEETFDTEEYKGSRFCMFCFLLNKLFDMIIELIETPSCIDNDSWIRCAREELNSRIIEIKTQSMNLYCKGVYTSLYSLWFMDDIISELDDSKINEKIKREIKLWIENIVECQNFVEGTKWKPYY